MSNKKKQVEFKYYVEGMHCASCEILVEKKLLLFRGVNSVEASLKSGAVVVECDPNHKKPTIEALNKAFKKDNYSFSAQPKSKRAKPKQVGRKSSFLEIVAIPICVIGIFIVLEKRGISSMVSVDSKSSLPMFLALGLIAGFSSCAALVGGIILSMSKQWADLYSRSDTFTKKIEPHLLFNIGRLVSYAIFGAALGAIGSQFKLSLSFTAGLVLAVSAIMTILSLQMLGVEYFQKFQFTMPKVVTRYAADESHFQGRWMPAAMGAFTFLLPCGFTITAQALALMSGSALQGGLITLFFALGTMPMLLVIGLSSVKFLDNPDLSALFMKTAGVLVLFFAFYNANAQLNVLGLPSFSDLGRGQSRIAAPGNIGKTQVIKLTVTPYGYNPDSFTVRVNRPVRWEITDKGASGCTNTLVSSLFDGQVALSPGKTSVKEFTPTQIGTYKFSCWMGMVQGTINVVSG